MLPDQVSNPEPLTYRSGALPIALRGPSSSVSGMEKEKLKINRVFRRLLEIRVPKPQFGEKTGVPHCELTNFP